jgi:RNA-directed DNA polymerase
VSTLSNGGTTWSTKLKRIRGLAEKDPSVVFNNLGHIIDMDFLLDTFRRLDGNKALGIDRISKEDYEYELGSNLTELLFRLRRGTYKPRASRTVKIPKADGGERMLAIACIEDKLVQLAVSRILEQIYEPSFIPESFGYRPGKSAHDAIRLLNRKLMDTADGALVEIDIRKYFSTIPHEPLLAMIKERISDQLCWSTRGFDTLSVTFKRISAPSVGQLVQRSSNRENHRQGRNHPLCGRRGVRVPILERRRKISQSTSEEAGKVWPAASRG